jgi:hypothetical protein
MAHHVLTCHLGGWRFLLLRTVLGASGACAPAVLLMSRRAQAIGINFGFMLALLCILPNPKRALPFG